MPPQYKQLCFRCKKTYTIVARRNPYATCYGCQQAELNAEITDPEMKKFFNIPEEFYKKNSFLRDIKVNYNKFGTLSDRQREAFTKTVEKIKKDKPNS